jgi:hypothetical protein
MVMHGNIRLPGRVYIESCGVIVCRGDVNRVDPAMREMVDVLPAGQQLGDRERLQRLHYKGWGLHSRETVELCRGIMSKPGPEVSLVYTHRGNPYQWKTPLLQSLLAMLGPQVRAHGLQVEQDHLPLDLVLFGVATLATCERCIIVKDNAIRVGAEEVVAASATQYLVLARGSGSWAIEGIVMDEEVPPCPCTIVALSLDEFLADGDHGMDSLSLTSRTATGCLGVIKLVRVGRKQGVLESPACDSGSAGETIAAGDPRGRRSSANASRVASGFGRVGVGNA